MNTVGWFYCDCREGYDLVEGTTCKGERNIFSQGPPSERSEGGPRLVITHNSGKIKINWFRTENFCLPSGTMSKYMFLLIIFDKMSANLEFPLAAYPTKETN